MAIVLKPPKRSVSHYHRAAKEGHTGFVYVCPGRFEMREKKPCANTTGMRLDTGLTYLHRLKPALFPYLNRYDYLITNAWPQVEYKALRNRSVPTKQEVLQPGNIKRLYLQIRHLTHIVACGDLAHEAIKQCIADYGLQAQVAYVKHTSQRALGCPKKALIPARMQQWAQTVSAQI